MAAGAEDRDAALKAMAEHRGCKLVKSRRRTPGVGDYGRYGLKDSATGNEVLGFGPHGLTATAEEVEAWLRGSLVSTWKKSVAEAPAPARKVEARRERRREPEAEPRRERASPAPPWPIPAPPAPPPRRALMVREALPRDGAAIAALVTELGFPNGEKEITKRLPALRKAGEPPLIAEESEVIGCLTWHVTPALHRPRPVGRVTMMVVTKKARGRGVGKALLEEAEARLRAAGCGLVEVTSNIELGGAHEFYRRRGFERTSYRFAKKLEP
jgi:ribosomal protein S18 acetylase RimI-like enzyme